MKSPSTGNGRLDDYRMPSLRNLLGCLQFLMRPEGHLMIRLVQTLSLLEKRCFRNHLSVAWQDLQYRARLAFAKVFKTEVLPLLVATDHSTSGHSAALAWVTPRAELKRSKHNSSPRPRTWLKHVGASNRPKRRSIPAKIAPPSCTARVYRKLQETG